MALVNRERCLSSHLSVHIGLGDEPGRCIRNTLDLLLQYSLWKRTEAYEVQDLSLHYQRMQAIHDLRHRGLKVPPVNVEDVDVAGPQTFEALGDGDVKNFEIISNLIGPDLRSSTLTIGRVLRDGR